MRIGFTGTQEGMTLAQKTRFSAVIRGLRPTEFHHGDCVGADAEAHDLAVGVAKKIVIHPPDSDAKRAFCPSKTVRSPRPYLERNQDIVNETHMLIAAPKANSEQLRSGTWATVRYARKIGRRVIIIWPNGDLKEDTPS